jgi:hypothetical protein
MRLEYGPKGKQHGSVSWYMFLICLDLGTVFLSGIRRGFDKNST